MDSLTVEQFITQYGRSLLTRDHHYSGPPHTHTPHGTGGPVFPDEGKLLASFAARHGGHVLEFGGSVGVSTRYIHEGLCYYHQDAPGDVISIDCRHLWMLDRDWPRRIPLESDSRDHRVLLNHFRNNDLQRFKWSFIDGLHSFEGVLNDLTLAILVGCHALIFHDCTPTHKSYDPLTGDGANVREAIAAGLYSSDWTKVYISSYCGMIAAFHKEWFAHGNSRQE